MSTKKQDILRSSNANLTNDFKAFVFRCLRGWWWFLLSGLISFALAWWYVHKQVPFYSVTSKVLIKSETQNDFGAEALFGSASPLLNSDLNLVNEMEILGSVKLMAKVVRAAGIHIRYFQEGRFVEEELYDDKPLSININDSTTNLYGKWLDVEQKDAEHYQAIITIPDLEIKERVGLDTLGGTFGEVNFFRGVPFTIFKSRDFEKNIIIRINAPDEVADYYAGNVSFQPVGDSEVISITFQDNVIPRAIRVIEVLVDRYNQEVLDDKNRSTRQRLDFIDERLNFISEELFQVERDLEDFKRTNDLPLNLSSTALTFLDRASKSDAALSQLELENSLLEGVENELNKSLSSTEDDLIVDFTIEGQTPKIIQQYNGLLVQRGQLLISATPSNPQVQAIESQIRNVKVNLRNWVAFKKNEFRQKMAYFESEAEPLNNQIDAIPKYEREMLQIMRQQTIKETLFTFLLQRREETAMTLASEVSNARIINAPVFNSQISPNKRLTYLIFMFFGVSLPAIGFFLLDYFDDKIYSQEDIKQRTQTPLLGSLAMAPKNEIDLAHRDMRSTTSEMFRMLRANLNFIVPGKKPQVILVTSSQSGEGKTFISINLGTSLAISGKSVVLVGMDLRKPALTRQLTGQRSEWGVSNYLSSNEPKLDEFIQTVAGIPNLHLIGSGPMPPNPAELLMRQRTKGMIAELRERYDYVIIDTSPVGLVVDALCLKEHVDTTLYITRFAVTRKSDLEAIEDIYINDKLPLPSIVLNGIKLKLGYGYGSYMRKYGDYSATKRSTWSKLKSRLGFR